MHAGHEVLMEVDVNGSLIIGSPGVNFTNILRAAFCTKVFCAAFMCLQFGFVNFWQKDFGAKAAHKMLVKLAPGHYKKRAM